MTKKAFVTGWPITHSKSPDLHGFWLKQYGLEGSYEAIGIEEDNFAQFLSSLEAKGLIGGNVTIPHKEKAFELVENLDAAAKAIGAVNTVWVEDGKLNGSNTDSYGFAANLDDFAPEWKNGKKALVLGAGGASRAIVYALLQAGYEEIFIINRTHSRAENLASHFGEKCQALLSSEISNILGRMDFVVNTTSVGMSGKEDSKLLDLSTLPKSAIVTDIIYTPLKTPFLLEAEALGLTIVDGLGMLLHQAVPGFEKWFGIRPNVSEELRNHILGLS